MFTYYDNYFPLKLLSEAVKPGPQTTPATSRPWDTSPQALLLTYA